MFDTLGQSDQTNGYMPWGKTQVGPMKGQQFSPQYQNAAQSQMQSPAQWQLDFNKGVAGSYNPQTPFGQGGSPTYGKQQMGLGNQKLGQDTPWGLYGPGGKGELFVSGMAAVGNLSLANRQLNAEDFRFERATEQWNKNYNNQVATVNNDLFDRQRRRNLESGMGAEAASVSADEYVRNRGVGQERNA